MCRKKILYIMGIDWNWIFQRPQIIEQYLEKKYDITVIFPRSILKWRRSEKCSSPKTTAVRVLWTIPKQERFNVIGWISGKFARKLFQDIDEFDAVILGYPLYYRYIPKTYKGAVIYDCMDRYRSLYPDSKSVHKLIREEERLIKECDAMVVTANKLYDNFVETVSSGKMELIRNGAFIKYICPPQSTAGVNKTSYKLGYIGTIAEWFDYELLINSIRKHKEIEYHLIGPAVRPCPIRSDQIIMEGVVPNSQLAEYTKDYDCLIMPFIVNDIVEWVDPVKLYEYIALGKCIISVRYEEINRFEPYVYMYSDEEEYEMLLEELLEKGFPAKYTKEQQIEFLNENSWEQRFLQWDKLLCRCIDENDKMINGEAKNED